MSDSFDPKDLDEWLAGGSFRNESFAGGANFSPTQTPSFDNKKGTSDINSLTLAGNFDLLNPALINNESQINMDVLDLYSFNPSTSSFEAVITFTITDDITNEVLVSRTNDLEDFTPGVDFAAVSLDMQNLADIYNEKLDLTTLSFTNPVTLAINIQNLTKSENINVAVGKVVYGTVLGQLKKVVINKVLQMLSLTNSFAILAVGFTLDALFNEVTEMAMGLDTDFGFGGELMTGIDGANLTDGGDKQYSTARDVITGLKGIAIDALGWGTVDGFSDITQADIDYGWERRGYTLSSVTQAGYQSDLSNAADNPQDIGDSYIGQDDSSSSSNNKHGGTGHSDNGGVAGGAGNTSGSGPGSPSDGGAGNGGSFSCFIAGTIVKVVYYQAILEIAIENVEIGYKLLGQDGSINTVLEFDRPITHGRPIYGFNQKEEFTTTEHMFLTTKGWKALVPKHAKEHHSDTFDKLDMTLDSVLGVGDVLVLIDGTEEVIETISKKRVDYDTKLYNFKLDGNNTYSANGYIVHNK